VGVKAKICGLRRAEDAAHAVRHGADFLGVVLDAGPRRATPAELKAIVTAAGDVPVLAVVVELDLDTVLRLRDATGFRGVQLHGGQDAAEALAFRRAGLLVWRTARLPADGDTRVAARFAEHADAVLVEPRIEGVPGGGGVPLDAELARRVRDALYPLPVVLAGGLRPDRVAHVAGVVRPYAVDVSSGVEQAPGVKDPVLVARFLEALREQSAGG